MKLHINYTKNGNKHSDFEAIEVIEKAIQRIKGTTQETEIQTTNQCVVNAARVALKKRDVLVDEISFYHEGILLTHNHNGEFKDYPKGFLEINTDLLLQLI